ncbi:hypothetical protein [Pseudarthrobacter sp. H2]|uniref:hypothetical protein n=1 Tax=Pseudarthrobacter sp. H2 TaxID=3418415 RepID=UPI003CEE4C5F
MRRSSARAKLKQHEPSSAKQTPAGGATAAPAESNRTEIFTSAFNSCNGESVVLVGTYDVVNKEQQDGSFFQYITIHAQGVGDQGNEYILKLQRQAPAVDS